MRGSKAAAQGKDNEDTIKVDRRKNIYIIADGMGGHEAPKTASELAVNNMYMEMCKLQAYLTTGQLKKDSIEDLLNEVVVGINKLISAAGKAEDYAMMGTTLDACLVFDNTAYFAHVGNGRVYSIAPSLAITKITKEHVDYGDEALKYPEDKRTVVEMGLGLGSYIGIGDELKVDIHHKDISSGETILMITDGIAHTLSQVEMLNAVTDIDFAKWNMSYLTEHTFELACAYSELKGLSLKQSQQKLNGKDNASFICIKKVA